MAVFSQLIYQTSLQIPTGTDPLVSHVFANPQSAALSVEGTVNSPPTLPSNSTIPIRISGTKKYGITARKIRIVRIAGDSPDFYRVYRSIVVFDPAYFVAVLSTPSPTILYEEKNDWILVGGENERYHLLFGAAPPP